MALKFTYLDDDEPEVPQQAQPASSSLKFTYLDEEPAEQPKRKLKFTYLDDEPAEQPKRKLKLTYLDDEPEVKSVESGKLKLTPLVSENTLAQAAAASPFVQHWLGSEDLSEDEKAVLAKAFKEGYDARATAGEEVTSKGERFMLNAKDAFFGTDSVGTLAGASIDWYRSGEDQRADVRAAQGRLLRYNSILEEFDQTGKKELYKDYQTMTREKVERWKANTLRELDRAKQEAHAAKVEWLVEKARAAGEWAGLPESRTLIDKGVALAGQLAGAMPTPENLIPGGGQAALGIRVLNSAAWTVFGNAITEPIVQSAAQERGVQEGIDLQGALVRTGLGVAANGMLTVSAEVPRAIANRFGLQKVKTGSVDEMVNDVAEQTGKTREEAAEAVQEFVEPKAKTGRKDGRKVAEDGTKELKFVGTVRESATTADPVRDLVSGVYEPIRNVDTLLAAQRIVDEQGEDAAELLVRKAKEPTAETYAVGMDLMRRWQEAGDYDRAAEMVAELGTKAKSQGQAIQSLSMWNRMTPEGALRAAQRQLPEGKVLTPNQMQDITDKAKLAQDALKRGNEVEQLKRAAELADAVKGVAPQSKGRMVGSISTMALLLNPKTSIRNIGGNVFLFGGNLVRDVAAVPIDAAVGVVTGKRSVTLPSMQAMVKGLSQPARDYLEGYNLARGRGENLPKSMREGVDTMLTMARLTTMNKFDLDDAARAGTNKTFGSNVKSKANPLYYADKALGVAESALSVSLMIPDRAFYSARYLTSLQDQVKRAGGIAPTDEMMQRAQYEASRAIFQNDNLGTWAVSGMKKIANLKGQFGAGDAFMRFTRVPVNILITAADWSPLGFVRQFYRASESLFRKNGYTQRDFVQGMTEAFIGTGTQLAAGYALGEMGIITSVGDADPELRQLRRMTGFDSYKINLSAMRRLAMSGDFTQRYDAQEGDVIYSYNWAAPFSLTLAAGAAISEKVRAGELQAKKDASVWDGPAIAWAAINGAALAIEEEPLFSGISALMRSYPDANESFFASMGRHVAGQMPGLFMPTALSQANQLQDNQVRETRGGSWIEEVGARLASRVPGLAQQLPVKYDVLGQPMERYQNATNTAFNVLFNPGFLSRVKKDPYLEELIRLYDTTGETRQIPRNVGKKVTVGGLDVELNREQVAEYQRVVGSIVGNTQRMLINGALGEMMMYRKEDENGFRIPFHWMSDEQKVDTLSKVMTDGNAVAKFFLFGDALPPIERKELLSSNNSQTLAKLYLFESPEQIENLQKYLWKHGEDPNVMRFLSAE